MSCTIWQYGLWSFQTWDTKVERFLPENQHTQRKLSNFENWVNGRVPKFDLENLKDINLGASFLLLTFFDTINFQIYLFSKMMPNF